MHFMQPYQMEMCVNDRSFQDRASIMVVGTFHLSQMNPILTCLCICTIPTPPKNPAMPAHNPIPSHHPNSNPTKYPPKTPVIPTFQKSNHIKRLHRRSLLHIFSHFPQLNRSRSRLSLRFRKLLPLIIRNIEITRLQDTRVLRMHHCDLWRYGTGKGVFDAPMIRFFGIVIILLAI